jgi:hypothetical protein
MARRVSRSGEDGRRRTRTHLLEALLLFLLSRQLALVLLMPAIFGDAFVVAILENARA